jgi:hypothetical protein
MGRFPEPGGGIAYSDSGGDGGDGDDGQAENPSVLSFSDERL